MPPFVFLDNIIITRCFVDFKKSECCGFIFEMGYCEKPRIVITYLLGKIFAYRFAFSAGFFWENGEFY